jgi:predicted ATPase/DNA-binding winged helix-turn-helix (wHTH) protein/tetratricopeptide (TPR) repeat protein
VESGNDRVIRFGPFELWPQGRRLLKEGARLPVGARAFDVLSTLVERRERIVTKGELLDAAWPGVVVEENNLPVQIGQLRKLLGRDAIATIPGRGYRFTAAIASELAVDAARNAAVTAATGPRGDPSADQLADRASAAVRPRGGNRIGSIARDRAPPRERRRRRWDRQELPGARRGALTARPLQDGEWTVELAGLVDPRRVPHAVAQALALALKGEAPADELVAAIAQRSMLLVLDNCEHLLDPVAALVQAILQKAPNVTIVATTQEPLHLPTEQQYRVMPLETPPRATLEDAREYGAIAMFESRLRSAARHFAITDASLALVVDICRRLDGLPLAIELAAARAATLGLGPVRDNLDARLRLLTGRARSLLPRHQALRAALEWSYNLLEDDEQAVLRRLGVCVGGFTVELAQSVAGDSGLEPWSVLDHLASLIDKSLVMIEGQHAVRYQLLESARAFRAGAARGQRAGAGTLAPCTRRRCAVRSRRRRQPRRRSQLRGARCAAPAGAGQSARGLRVGQGGRRRSAGRGDAGIMRGGARRLRPAECVDWLLALRSQVESDGLDGEVRARYWRAVAASTMNGRIPRALQADAAERAAALYRELGKPRRVYSALIQLAKHRTSLGDSAGARRATEDARALERPQWPAMLRTHLLRLDGHMVREAGAFEDAVAIFRETVRLSALTEDWQLEVIARANLADLLWQVGPLEEAADVARALVEELRARPSTEFDEGWVLSSLMGILCEMGHIDAASAAGREALPLMRRCRTYYLDQWAYLFWCRGQTEVSKALLGSAETECLRQAAGEGEEPTAPVGFVVGVPTAPRYNEARLITKLRAGLGFAPGSSDPQVAAGSSLREPEWLVLISKALAA